MHEWALAEAVLETIKNEQEREGRPAARALVRFGELQNIDPGVFASGLDQLLAGNADLAVKLEFQTEPASFVCVACETSWMLSDCDLDEATAEAIHFLPEVAHSFIECPGCGSVDFRVETGRGVTVESIEYEGTAND